MDAGGTDTTALGGGNGRKRIRAIGSRSWSGIGRGTRRTKRSFGPGVVDALVLWECQLKDTAGLRKRIGDFLEGRV